MKFNKLVALSSAVAIALGLAACGGAPMMQINDRYYEDLDPKKVDRILADLKKDGKSDLAMGPFMLPVMQG